MMRIVVAALAICDVDRCWSGMKRLFIICAATLAQFLVIVPDMPAQNKQSLHLVQNNSDAER